jgi:hypothetical protein
VLIFNDGPDTCYLAEVFVDGKRAQHFVLHGPRDTKTFVGFAQRIGHRGSEKSFCFSMPRPVFEVAGRSNIEPEQDEEKLIEIGSVRIDLHETFFTKKEVRIERRKAAVSTLSLREKKTAKSLGSTAAVRAGAPCLPHSQPLYRTHSRTAGPTLEGKLKKKMETVSYYDPPKENNKVTSGRIFY